MYLKRLLIVTVLSFVIAYVAGTLFDSRYRKRWSKVYIEKTDSLVKGSDSYDVIFFGNSRVHFGINPYYFDSSTNLSSYNFGYGGADMKDIELTSAVFFKQHPLPKMVVLSLDMGGMAKNVTLKTRFHNLFYLANDSIDQYMNNEGFLTSLMKIFPFTKYSFLDEYNRTSLFLNGNPIPEFDHNIYRGFLNIHQRMNTTAADMFNIRQYNESLWDSSVIYLRNTMNAIIKQGCPLILIYPPERDNSTHRGTAFRKSCDSIFAGIANEYHLKYLHFENSPRYSREYFVDDVHLNEPGSRMFSLELADSVKKLFRGIK